MRIILQYAEQLVAHVSFRIYLHSQCLYSLARIAAKCSLNERYISSSGALSQVGEFEESNGIMFQTILKITCVNVENSTNGEVQMKQSTDYVLFFFALFSTHVLD